MRKWASIAACTIYLSKIITICALWNADVALDTACKTFWAIKMKVIVKGWLYADMKHFQVGKLEHCLFLSMIF